MSLRQINLILLVSLILAGCEKKLENTWQTKPFFNAYGKEQGVALYIAGEQLSDELESAQVNFSLNEDLISGGFKEIFTFSLNGSTSMLPDSIEVINPGGEPQFFEIYDGLLFNVDFESNEVSRFMELMNYPSLEIRAGEHSFSISTRQFLKLYRENFYQENS